MIWCYYRNLLRKPESELDKTRKNWVTLRTEILKLGRNVAIKSTRWYICSTIFCYNLRGHLLKMTEEEKSQSGQIHHKQTKIKHMRHQCSVATKNSLFIPEQRFSGKDWKVLASVQGTDFVSTVCNQEKKKTNL